MVGFKWSAFTEQQRRKISADPQIRPSYTARGDILFPFLTSEVTCGKKSLDLADRANADSMTIAVRDVVGLFRKTGGTNHVDQAFLGFSVTRDHTFVRLYAYYPRTARDKTSVVRYTMRSFDYTRDEEARWTCYKITRQIYEYFAFYLLIDVKNAIDKLPDPMGKE